jgi:hypothetical protein
MTFRFTPGEQRGSWIEMLMGPIPDFLRGIPPLDLVWVPLGL